MKRDIHQALVKWKGSPERKPLVLRGARQVGKTYALQEFGKQEYERCHYLNFEAMPEIAAFFGRNLQPSKVLPQLCRYLGAEIRPGRDLLILDEIQACGQALAALKYFQEEAPEYHVAAAGSLLGIKMAGPGTFPVGKVNFLALHPMTFLEFLDAVGEGRYRELIEQVASVEPLAEPFHRDLVEQLRAYYLVGGMPAAVLQYSSGRDVVAVRTVQQEILQAYELDFSKHAPPLDIPRLSLVWQALPLYLSRENKKFMFSALRPGARARDYESALRWLCDAGLVRQAFAAEQVGLPLAGYASRSDFKVYLLDTGLLSAMARVEPQMLDGGSKLFTTYHGALVENYAAQQLSASTEGELVYWKSEGKRAEVDFVLGHQGRVLPLEVKAGVNPRAKSLLSFDKHFGPPLLVRTTLLNLRRDGRVLNVPLYALNRLLQLIDLALSGKAA